MMSHAEARWRSPVGFVLATSIVALGPFACSRILGIEDAHEKGELTDDDGGRPSTNPTEFVPQPDATCSADLKSDPKNCGYCGLDCQGGSCAEGRCQPVTFTTGQQGTLSLAAGTGGVVWIGADSASSFFVRICSTTGCGGPPRTLLRSPSGEYLNDIALTDTDVYFHRQSASGRTLERCALFGCDDRATAIVPVDAGVENGPFYVSKSEFVLKLRNFDASGFPPFVARCPQPNCRPPTVIFGDPGWTLVADPTDVYFAVSMDGGHAIMHCSGHGPCAAPEPTGAWTPEIPAELALGPTSLVWVAYADGKYPADLRRCATPLCAGGPLTLVNKDYEGSASRLAVSGRYVYWTKTSEGTVKRCLLTGCDGKPEILARDQGQPRAIAIHAGALYFANWASGEIMKLVPPP